MLDDANVLRQRDSKNALGVAASEYQLLAGPIELMQSDHDSRPINNVALVGLGNCGLAAGVVQALLAPTLAVPLQVVQDGELPQFVGRSTLLVLASNSGDNTEVLSCAQQALARQDQPQIAIITGGGTLKDIAVSNDILYTTVPGDVPGRFALLHMVKGLLSVLDMFDLGARALLDEVAASAEWLHNETLFWEQGVPTAQNYAKQLALIAVGKTPVFYAGPRTAPLAGVWKARFNQIAKNVAFAAAYPAATYTELHGWKSHPVEKPFAVFDLWSEFETESVQKQFKQADKRLSGKRPKANVVALQGESLARQILWGCALADFVGIYVAILNGVNPAKVEQIERLKKELQ